MRNTQSIPDEVLDKIERHRPHLRLMIANLRARPDLAQILERRIADAYLAAEPHLTGLEIYYLAYCCNRKPYGGGP